MLVEMLSMSCDMGSNLVGEEYIGKFIAEFMVSAEVNQEEDGQGAAAARVKEDALVKKMYVGVEKAAGGNLMELK